MATVFDYQPKGSGVDAPCPQPKPWAAAVAQEVERGCLATGRHSRAAPRHGRTAPSGGPPGDPLSPRRRPRRASTVSRGPRDEAPRCPGDSAGEDQEEEEEEKESEELRWERERKERQERRQRELEEAKARELEELSRLERETVAISHPIVPQSGWAPWRSPGESRILSLWQHNLDCSFFEDVRTLLEVKNAEKSDGEEEEEVGGKKSEEEHKEEDGGTKSPGENPLEKYMKMVLEAREKQSAQSPVSIGPEAASPGAGSLSNERDDRYI
ncbi:hypothetical protein N1851_028998 [Merluccius polli]|uniref:Uncharacterized protein n=1 Tax=Merluccius polli TaxID=89951 RepID=A0AA47M7Q2_MERPO|nr:hypothetical protein N1851_028998 [Merluccius polli]